MYNISRIFTYLNILELLSDFEKCLSKRPVDGPVVPLLGAFFDCVKLRNITIVSNFLQKVIVEESVLVPF